MVHLKAQMGGSGDAEPFPAAFNIEPVFRWSSPALAPIAEVLIKRSEPLAYAVRSFSLERLVLADFTIQN